MCEEGIPRQTTSVAGYKRSDPPASMKKPRKDKEGKKEHFTVLGRGRRGGKRDNEVAVAQTGVRDRKGKGFLIPLSLDYREGEVNSGMIN